MARTQGELNQLETELEFVKEAIACTQLELNRLIKRYGDILLELKGELND